MTAKGFSLIELMIVIVIIGILGAVAMPVYQSYTRRAHFAEVVNATAPYKIAVTECYQVMGALQDCNAGSHSIPTAITAGSSGTLVDSITVSAGVITATPKAQQGLTASDTYILTPTAEAQHIRWQSSGGAVAAGYAK